LFNDKILMECRDEWSMMTEVYIAYAPENPFVDGCFNVNFLQSTGGNFSLTWINTYWFPVD
jgi:hypothetical protein